MQTATRTTRWKPTALSSGVHGADAGGHQQAQEAGDQRRLAGTGCRMIWTDADGPSATQARKAAQPPQIAQ